MPTFDLVSQLAALVLRVVDDGRRGGRPEKILLYLAPVPLLPGKHSLATLPLVEVVSGLGEVHVEAARVLFVCAGAQAYTVTYERRDMGEADGTAGNSPIKIKSSVCRGRLMSFIHCAERFASA